jgi:hypothetical protein
MIPQPGCILFVNQLFRGSNSCPNRLSIELKHGNSKSTRTWTTQDEALQEQRTGLGGKPAKAWCLYQGLYDYAEET